MERAVRLTYGMTMAEFEQRWQRQTRRRYGGLALIGDVTLAGLLLLVIIVPLYVLRAQRDRRRMAALVEADRAAEAAARESAIEALLRGDEPPESESERPESTPS